MTKIKKDILEEINEVKSKYKNLKDLGTPKTSETGNKPAKTKKKSNVAKKSETSNKPAKTNEKNKLSKALELDDIIEDSLYINKLERELNNLALAFEVIPKVKDTIQTTLNQINNEITEKKTELDELMDQIDKLNDINLTKLPHELKMIKKAIEQIKEFKDIETILNNDIVKRIDEIQNELEPIIKNIQEIINQKD